ncbi:Selenoprotein Pa [Habropoda laboriosa]|uniref:Selenoprotein Pa n=1 Tax=Habropoda laboriosa TaxID=597456 RepID=A0A0L7RFX1_9HYME|nr:Selenoprotein Pa [Habropoda laboriosa]
MSILITILSIMTITMTVTAGDYETYEKDRVSRLADFSRHFRWSKESRASRGYAAEQCRDTNLWKEQLGHVNVFAFLDPSWYYSYRQAIMLEMLQKKFEKSGFTNILFFVVTPLSDISEDNMENNVEVKAWREISRNRQKSEYYLATEGILLNEFTRKKESVIFLRDSPELRIWESFHASKDEVVVVDRCGKLTYQVIVPWSILYFPYVKAAILSTYKEDPCGPCDEESDTTTVGVSEDYEKYVSKGRNSGEETVDENFHLPTEDTFTDSETVTVTSDKSKGMENENSTSTVVPIEVDTYENNDVYDITTDASIVQAETTEDVKKDVKDSTFFTDENIEITSEVPLEREETQILTTISDTETTEVSNGTGETKDHVSSNEEITTSNENSFLKINASNVDLRTNEENGQSESNVSFVDEEVNVNVERKELQVQNNESMPLRIILYAPHLHKGDGTLKKYTHLVLKTGSPDYHDHFHSRDTTSDEEPVVLEKSDSTILEDKKLAKYMHSVNENPGLYGEISDYWRTADEEELDNKKEDTGFPDYDYATVTICNE